MLTYTVIAAASPEQVWQAITDPDLTAKYFYDCRVASTFEPGAPYVAAAGETTMVDGEILEAEPPRVLRHTWRSLWDPEAAVEPASRVSWELEPQADGTKLTVTHDRLEQSPKTAASVEGGWEYVLGGLKSVVETGAPLVQA